jgi:diaminohydroxyphosphoribosylaminopyrimidine deaminase/5-amino-6-(5-phosphoribosylamino)uracil reductase
MTLLNDEYYMSRALQLAELGTGSTDPNPKVGCVLVQNNSIVGEGWHRVAGGNHAEINALLDAGEAAKGATCYISLEPCCFHGRTPPCTNSLIKAGIKHVIIAMLDPNPKVSGKGVEQLKSAGIKIKIGVLQQQANNLNIGFITRMSKNRPYIRAKMAMSLDGRTAMASGESQWITGASARVDVQKLRAYSSAIMIGVGTVLADNPSLTVRENEFPNYIEKPEYLLQPLRIIIDQNLSMPITAKMLNLPGKTIIFTATDDAESRETLEQNNAYVVYLPNLKGGVNLHAMCNYLGEQGINDVLLEGGSTIAGAMLSAGLVDELIIYMAPVLMGNKAMGLFSLPLDMMKQKINLEIKDIRAIGDDWKITARPLITEKI